MAPWNFLIRAFLVMEDSIVQQILARPGFHHFVRRVRNRVEDYRHGRDPNEPLRQGEATEDPNASNIRGRGFLSYFVEEINNQFRGAPTKPPGPQPPDQPKR